MSAKYAFTQIIFLCKDILLFMIYVSKIFICFIFCVFFAYFHALNLYNLYVHLTSSSSSKKPRSNLGLNQEYGETVLINIYGEINISKCLSVCNNKKYIRK